MHFILNANFVRNYYIFTNRNYYLFFFHNLLNPSINFSPLLNFQLTNNPRNRIIYKIIDSL